MGEFVLLRLTFVPIGINEDLGTAWSRESPKRFRTKSPIVMSHADPNNFKEIRKNILRFSF